MSYPANNFDTGTFAGERWQPHVPVRSGIPEPLAAQFTADAAQVYRSLGFDVPRSSNAQLDLMVAIPATFVIDTHRVIRFAFVNPDDRRRAEPADIVDVLQRI